ncbi:MAG: PAS domain S-box protein [Betaproteobacteria bacterium]|nr:PAS domain S-box protein [Betaproteobacteria bacterium]
MPSFVAHRPFSALTVALGVFLLAAVASASLVWRSDQYRLQERRTSAAYTASDHAHAIERNIDRALSATYTLAALVHQGNGTISNLDEIGRQLLPRYPGVASVSLAPAGIIRAVVPLAGNEKALNLDLLNNPATRKEASTTRDTGKLTLVGPFKLVTDELAAVGRLPLFLDDAKGGRYFWGFINVVIGFPETLEAAGLPDLAAQGYAYELWRTHPERRTREIIAASSSTALVDPVEQTLQVPNATWTLSVMPAKGWGDPLGLSLKGALGLLFSVLLGYVAKFLVESKAHAKGLEALVAQRTAQVAAREARYRAVTYSANEAIITVGADGNIVGWNRGAGIIFGYAEAEIVGRQLTLLVPHRYHDRFLEGMKRAFAGEQSDLIGRSVELTGQRKDRSEFRLDLSLATWETDEGRFVTGIIRDITERKRSEEALRESEARFRSLTEMSSDFYWETDAEHRLVEGTWEVPNVAPIWRPPIGKRRWELPSLSPDEAGWQAHRAVLDEHQPFRDFQLSRLGSEGTEHYLSVSGDPVFDASGKFAGYHGVATDITERKHSEKALRAAEEQFRGLVEQAIAGIYIIQDGRIVYANPRAAEILGQGSTGELIGSDPLLWVAEADRSKVAESMRRLIEGEARSVALDFDALRRDGVTIQVGANAARAPHEGRPAIIGLMQEISEKKRAEEEIRRYVGQLETAFMSTVKVATTLGEMRDPYTAGHQRRVAEIAVAIGSELGFDARRQEGLRVAGYLHDIGKMTIPAEILAKPSQLTPIEMELIKAHPQASYEVLKDVDFPWPVARVALEHHERMDGSGYPQGLKGEAILLESRIMAVADVIEAMASHRPYRPGLGLERALAEIERGRGSAYDPAVADACLRLFREKHYQLPA